MLKAGITIGCAAALLVAAGLTSRLRLTRRVPSPLTGSEPFGERLSVTVGRTGGMLVGAVAASVLTIGAGGRLMMRVLAATSPDDVQGLRTEADEVIGEVSTGGSFFLIVAVGIGAALVGLALYSSLRRWLPDRSLAAGLVGVAIGAGLLVRPVGLISATNVDFELVAPAALAVALTVAALVLFGATFGVLVDWLAPRWPRPGWSPRGVAAVLPFAVLLAAAPLLLVTALAVIAGTVAPTLRSSRPSDGAASVEVDTGTRRGRVAVLVLGGLGTLSVAVAAAQVLTL